MSHKSDGNLFALLGNELSKNDAAEVAKHVSSCRECEGIMNDLRGFKENATAVVSSDSHRFVRSVMNRIEAEERASGFSLWDDIRVFFVPTVLALASLCFVVVGGRSSDVTFTQSDSDFADSDFEAAFGSLNDDSDPNLVLFGAEEVDGGLVL